MEWIASHAVAFWIALGLILITLEIFVGDTLLLWNGTAAVVVGVLVWLLGLAGISPIWPVQWLLFGIGSIAALFAWRTFQRKAKRQPDVVVNQRMQQYIGREAELRDPITNGYGTISLNDSLWRVAGPDLPAGARVRIVGTNDAVFSVVPAPKN